MNETVRYIRLARPHHYIKNGFLFLPLLFAHRVTDTVMLGRVALGFVAFSLASSAIYVLNDVIDAPNDRLHPVKKHRPVASGAVPPSRAVPYAALLAAAALVPAVATFNPGFLVILGLYAALNISYTLGLKKVAIVDVVCVAAGFVLRVHAGAALGRIEVSHWIVLMTFLLAMFLAFAKRRDDLMLENDGVRTRDSLDGYNLEFVSTSMMVMAAVTVVSYILYTVSPEVIAKHGSADLYMTSFWVLVGLLRYMQQTFVRGRSGSPVAILYTDPFLQAVLVLWLVNFLVLIHVPGL